MTDHLLEESSDRHPRRRVMTIVLFLAIVMTISLGISIANPQVSEKWADLARAGTVLSWFSFLVAWAFYEIVVHVVRRLDEVGQRAEERIQLAEDNLAEQINRNAKCLLQAQQDATAQVYAELKRREKRIANILEANTAEDRRAEVMLAALREETPSGSVTNINKR